MVAHIVEQVRRILEARYPSDLVSELIRAYTDVRTNYHLGKYKPTEVEAGFFVECVRRVLSIELFGTVIPLGSPLPNFDHKAMSEYATAHGKDPAFTLHIPRVLWSIYVVRNQRGAAHVAQVSPNKMDSMYVVAGCDWVMAELVRQASTLPPEECQALIDQLVERKVPIIWSDGTVKRVLDTKRTAREQVLILLYSEQGQRLTESDLIRFVEYKNASAFRSKVLGPLHKERLIERRDGWCQLTFKGVREAENLIARALV